MQPRPTVIVFDVNETLSDMAPLAARFADVGAPDLLAKVWFGVLLRDGFALAATGGQEQFARLAAGALRAALAGAHLNRPADDAIYTWACRRRVAPVSALDAMPQHLRWRLSGTP